MIFRNMTFEGVFGAAEFVTLRTLVAGRLEMFCLDVILDPGGVPGAVVTQPALPAAILTPEHVGPDLIIQLLKLRINHNFTWGRALGGNAFCRPV